MTKSYPETIPESFTRDDLADAYKRGWNHGHGIACHNVPELGTSVRTEEYGLEKVTPETIRSVHADLCYEAADHSRAFSPFEFTANKFNSAEIDEDGEWDPDKEGLTAELWGAFEMGASDAISADLAEYTDADYGISSVTS